MDKQLFFCKDYDEFSYLNSFFSDRRSRTPLYIKDSKKIVMREAYTIKKHFILFDWIVYANIIIT